MKKFLLAAVAATTMTFAFPASAQELPLVPGDYWDVTGISIDDGHFADYADFLAAEFRKESDFSKSKGWIKGYHILSNVNAREIEPDLYLIRIFDHVPTSAEDLQREKEINAHMAQTTRAALAASGHRATFRHVKSNELLQELNWAH
jgi:hypothetical protein